MRVLICLQKASGDWFSVFLGTYPPTGQCLQMVQLSNTFDFRIGTLSPRSKKNFFCIPSPPSSGYPPQQKVSWTHWDKLTEFVFQPFDFRQTSHLSCTPLFTLAVAVLQRDPLDRCCNPVWQSTAELLFVIYNCFSFDIFDNILQVFIFF